MTGFQSKRDMAQEKISMTKEALKLALEALHYCEALNHSVQQQKVQAITAIQEALAQPVQEPVAWVSEDVCEGQYIDGRLRKIWWECEKGVGMAFYTTPPLPVQPERPWVGLTAAEISNFVNVVWPVEATSADYVRAIEQALKEKNNG